MGDMLQAARWVQKQTGTPLATIVTKATAHAFRSAGFDNQQLSQFMDLIDEVTEELVITEDELRNPETRNPSNGTSNER